MSLLKELRNSRVAADYRHRAPNGAQNLPRVVVKVMTILQS